MKSSRWLLSLAALVLLAGVQKVEAADSLTVQVNATIEVATIAWNAAGTDTAAKSWSPAFTAYSQTSAAQVYTVHNKNTYSLNLAVSASDAASTWKLKGTAGADEAVLTADGTSLDTGAIKSYPNVGNGGTQAVSLVLTSPASGATTSGQITVTVLATPTP